MPTFDLYRPHFLRRDLFKRLPGIRTLENLRDRGVHITRPKLRPIAPFRPIERPVYRPSQVKEKIQKRIEKEDKMSIKKPLPLGSYTFTESDTSTSHTFVVEPQRSFRPERLLAVVKRTSGATATEVWLKNLLIEGESQMISTEYPLSLDMLQHDAVGIRWDMRDVQAAKKIQATVEVSELPAAGSGDKVIVTLVAWGEEL